MKTFLKIGGIILLSAAAILFIIRYTTKAHSPEETIRFQKGSLELEVFYNRPYKKDRKIFGELVPFNTVWRTGANEATTFKTNQDLLIDGSELQAGKYSLWTIPMEKSWKIIFNAKMYPWGINLEEEAYRNPAFDALILEVPVTQLEKPLEQFTISFEQEGEFILMVLAWDRTRVTIPIKGKASL